MEDKAQRILNIYESGVSETELTETLKTKINASIGGSLGSIKPADAAPTPARNGNYTFSIGGDKPAWLTAEAGVTTVKAGDGVSVVYTAPSSYTYTHVDVSSDFVTIQELNYLADKQKIIAGINLFTISGYVKETTRAVVSSTNFKCTDFIRYTDLDPIYAYQVFCVGAEFRQVMFYSDKTDASYLGAWTTNDNLDLVLNSGNVPSGTKYVRFNSSVSYTPIELDAKIKYESTLSIGTNTDLDNEQISNNLDVENNLKIKSGTDLFTIVGYLNHTTGLPDSNPIIKRTDFLSLELISEIKVENLAYGGACSQASFFSTKTPDGLISSYIGAYAGGYEKTIVLTKENIPNNAKYVVFHTLATSTPKITIGKINTKSAVPVNTLLGKAAWKFINTTSGYSDNWGQYWDGSAFVTSNHFNANLYDVNAINGSGAIHIKGWFYGNMPIVVFFQDQSLTAFVANGVKRGTITPTYYDFYENVPAGSNYALVQQSRTIHPTPVIEMVVDTTEIETKKKVVLIGDSLTQMANYADELMGNIKELAPEYDIYNYGIGGEKTNEIASRVGAFQMFLTPDNAYLATNSANGQKFFDLPGDMSTVNIGATAISNSWNSTKLNLLLQSTPSIDCSPEVVFIDGIECLLSWTGSTYTLNRTTAGGTHSVFYGSQMTPKNSLIMNEDDIAIVNIGANGGYIDTDDLVEQTKRVVESLGTKKYIVLSCHYAQNTDNSPSRHDYIDNRIIEERELKKAFGARYINTREYLCSTALYDALSTTYWNNDSYPTDTVGETHPTATDTEYMTAGMYAPMWWVNPNNPADIIHISRRTYYVYYRHIFNTMKALGYFN